MKYCPKCPTDTNEFQDWVKVCPEHHINLVDNIFTPGPISDISNFNLSTKYSPMDKHYEDCKCGHSSQDHLSEDNHLCMIKDCPCKGFTTKVDLEQNMISPVVWQEGEQYKVDLQLTDKSGQNKIPVISVKSDVALWIMVAAEKRNFYPLATEVRTILERYHDQSKLKQTFGGLVKFQLEDFRSFMQLQTLSREGFGKAYWVNNEINITKPLE